MVCKKVFLLTPPYKGTRVKGVFSAGLGYVAESLKTAGIEYDICNMSLGYDYKYLKNKINEFAPELIGISVMTYRYKQTYELIKTLKNDFPQIKIVAGGPHISLFREEVLTACPQLDFGIVLEGEETIVELCSGAELESIKGLIYQGAEGGVYNGDRPFIDPLDEIAFPKYEKFEMERIFNKEINSLPIVSSRGCPFACVYCSVKFAVGCNFRVRSPESIIKELKYWYDKGYKRFSFADDNFTLKKQRIVDLCEALKQSGMNDLKLSCDNGIRADKVDRDLLKLMKDVGFYRIAFGVEAGNNKVLKQLKKSENIETITARIEEACELGYEMDLFFLVGSPRETWEDLQDSFDIALKYPIGSAYFYNIIPFPHTELFDWIKEKGKFLKNPEDYLDDYPILDNVPVFETPEMSFELRKKALKKAFGITRKTMYRAWTNRLSKLGVLGKILAYIYTRTFVQDVLLRNKITRKIIYGVAWLFIKK
ncbi:MAG: radical SAM protein [PVC group bacterium]|nr:radical SAM protein [PVC group bacterium]